MNIFKALFGSKSKPAEEVKKDVTRDFNVLKYDGVRALRERQFDYAIQCLLRAIDMNGAIWSVATICRRLLLPPTICRRLTNSCRRWLKSVLII